MERRFWKVSESFIWTSEISLTKYNFCRWNWFNNELKNRFRGTWSKQKNEDWTSNLTWWTDKVKRRESIFVSCKQFTLGSWHGLIKKTWKKNFGPLTWRISKGGNGSPSLASRGIPSLGCISRRRPGVPRCWFLGSCPIIGRIQWQWCSPGL
jgi:hypothetical protein